MYLENFKCGKGDTNLSVDFGDLVTQPRKIDAEQGSKNQNVNISDNIFLFFTIMRGSFHIKKVKNMKYLLCLTYPGMMHSYDTVCSGMF